MQTATTKVGAALTLLVAVAALAAQLSSAADHNPSWPDAFTCRYGLPGEGTGTEYVDEMDPGGYAMCRFGNYLTRDSGWIGRDALSFNYLTTGPFTTAGMDSPHQGGLFIWGEDAPSDRRFTFSELNAGSWVAPPPGGTGSVEVDLNGDDRSLYRYFTMSDSQLPGVEAGVRKYVILIHGWNPSSNQDSYTGAQFSHLSSALQAWLDANGGTDWRVVKYHMERDTDTGPVWDWDGGLLANAGTRSAEIARLHGYHMAKQLLDACPDIEQVHLIAHSAGSWAARSCLQYLLANNSSVMCQMTLLDAYIPEVNNLIQPDSVLDVPEMNAVTGFQGSSRVFGLDNYFASMTLDQPATGTQESFNWGSLELVADVTVSDYGQSQWYRHDGPIEYYADSVDHAGNWRNLGYAGGFELSLTYTDVIQGGLPDETWMDGFTTYPEPVTQGNSMLFTAHNVRHPDGNAIAAVYFYRDSNFSGALEVGTDESIGSGQYAGGDWILLRNIIPWEARTHSFFARARDDQSNYSEPAACLAHVQSAAAQPGDSLTRTGDRWEENGGGSDGDGVLEAGEPIRFKFRVRSDDDLTRVYASVSTSDPDIEITGDSIYFDDLSSGETAWCIGWFSARLNFALSPGETRTARFTVRATYEKDSFPYYQDIALSQTVYRDGDRRPDLAIDHVQWDDTEDGNGNNIPESGEFGEFHIHLVNNGPVEAEEVKARVTSVSAGGTSDSWRYYPDIPPGGSSPAHTHFAITGDPIPQTHTGPITGDITVQYMSGGALFEQTYSDQLLFSASALPWMTVTPTAHNFGVRGTDQDVTLTVTVHSTGSQALQVQTITMSHPDTTWTGDALPWSLPPGSTRTLEVTVETSALQGLVQRQVRVGSDGGLTRNDEDAVDIGGLVSDMELVYKVPGASPGEYVDVSGNIIVWRENRGGNTDIYAYDLARDMEYRITTNAATQTDPKIGGNLIVWEDARNSGSGFTDDIYGWYFPSGDVGAGQEVAISTDSAYEDLVGVDNAKVAFSRVYYWPSVPYAGARNLHVYDAATTSTAAVPGFSGTSPRQSLYRPDWDFGGGILTFVQAEYEEPNSFRNGRLMKYEVGVDASPSQIRPGWTDYGPKANDGRIVWAEEDGGGKRQIWQWFGGSHNQETTESVNHAYNDDLSCGDGYAVYDKHRSTGLFVWDIAANSESVVTTNRVNHGSPGMDGNLLVWSTQEGDLCYAFLGSKELTVSPADIQFSDEVPVEGGNISVTVTVHNLKGDLSGGVTVRLFDGDPDSGGSQVGGDQAIPGGVPGRGTATVSFSSISVGVEGSSEIFARVYPTDSENPANNTAFRTLNVGDSDQDGPAITAVAFAEHNGDGDGLIGDDEQIRVSWSLADPSGISTASLAVASDTIPLGGDYWAVTGPLARGRHAVSIAAADADVSPESSSWEGHFDVVPSEEITLLHDGSPVACGAGTTVDLGLFSEDVPPDPAILVVRNDGEQALALGSCAVPASFTNSGPQAASLPPGGVATVSLSPDTSESGTYTGLVSLANGDADESPFVFSVRCEVREDTDGDGIRDSEERRYFAHLDGMTATSDTDGDGFLDRFEFRAATDPIDDASYLGIVGPIGATGGVRTVRWLSVSNRLYRVDCSTNLPGGFRPVASNIPGVQGTNSYGDTNAPGSRALFYRIGLDE
jgi:beta propeller repeat protein